MTVTISRTQIHLGWPTAGSMVLFLIVITWQLGTCFNGFINAQHEMQRQLAAIAKRDSIYYLKVDEQAKDILLLKFHQDSLANDLNFFRMAVNGLKTEKN